MTIMEPTPTPTDPPSGRRRAIILAAAAGAVVLVVGAVVLATRDDDTEPVTNQPPPATHVAEGPVNATAADVAQGFVEAYGAFDAERAVSYLAEDADVTGLIEEYNVQGNVDQIPLVLAWLEVIDYQQMLRSCEEPTTSATGTSVRCRYDYHSFGSDELGLGPFRGSYFDLTVRDGKILQATGNVEISTSSYQTWEPFDLWIGANYPADAEVLYDDQSHSAARLTEESLRLWERRVQEYVDSRVAASG